MWTHQFEAKTDLPPDALWSVIADIARWPEIDRQIESLEVNGPVDKGTTFQLKPKGGPTLQLTVAEFSPPYRYADVCQLPLGEMKTVHAFDATEEGSTIRVEIEIPGVLGWFWGLVVGRKHASGLQRQTQLFVERARSFDSQESHAS